MAWTRNVVSEQWAEKDWEEISRGIIPNFSGKVLENVVKLYIIKFRTDNQSRVLANTKHKNDILSIAL
jgi:hypothetical protein